MALLIGLGNSGKEYACHRHNVGFMAVDEIAQKYRFPSYREQFGGLVCQGRIELKKVVLFKPATFMNLSGRPAGLVARFFKIPLSEIIVMHDDIDIAPGRIRVKTGGGTGGHNGIKSIDEHLGRDYGRVRIGVGRPEVDDNVSDYVLGNFRPNEYEWLRCLMPAIAAEIPTLLRGDSSSFCNRVFSSIANVLPKSQAGR